MTTNKLNKLYKYTETPIHQLFLPYKTKLHLKISQVTILLCIWVYYKYAMQECLILDFPKAQLCVKQLTLGVFACR